MAQDYDKIIKENIEAIILPLAERLLGIRPEKMEEIPDDLQTTLERRPDFLKTIQHQDKAKDYILHIEFQVEDLAKMVARMLEYYGILFKKYEMDVRQYVFYIGKESPKMRTSLKLTNLEFSFNVLDIRTFDYRQFLASDTPEEVILAILGDFKGENPERAVRMVLERLKSLPTETLRREKCVKQLEMLSNLRDLQPEIIKQLAAMPFTYDLKKDIRFQQGLEQGQIETIKEMLKDKFSVEQIAKYVKVTTDFVKNVADGMKN